MNELTAMERLLRLTIIDATDLYVSYKPDIPESKRECVKLHLRIIGDGIVNISQIIAAIEDLDRYLNDENYEVPL